MLLLLLRRLQRRHEQQAHACAHAARGGAGGVEGGRGEYGRLANVGRKQVPDHVVCGKEEVAVREERDGARARLRASTKRAPLAPLVVVTQP